MIFDNADHDRDRRWYLPASGNGDGQDTKLARLVAQETGRAPGGPGSWSRFLVAHARWIMGVTLVAVVAAAAFALSQTPLYLSQAEVVVQPAPALSGNTAQPPDMSTEVGVATSGNVLHAAAKAIGVPAATLSSGVSVKAQGSGYVLQISYSNPNPRVAQRGTQAITQAYMAFRSPGSGSRARSGTTPTATLITPASLPTSPYSPDYLVDIVVALIVGLALAVATAWGRDYLDDHLRGPLDLQREADADVLAVIPAFRPDGQEPRHRLVMAESPGSIVAEAYRSLRTRVLLTMAASKSRTLLVTSPVWEEKGTVAANLAAALAQSGRKTVLVCADPHWGDAHLVVGTWDGGPGLTGLLERRTDVASALQHTRVPGLRLLPPGRLCPDPAALLEGPTLRAVLDDIRSQADVLVIEASPLLASPEARPLADAAEIIMLVTDARASTRAQVRAAARELAAERARLAGCVLVNVGRRRRLRRDLPDSPSEHEANDRSRRPAVSNDSGEPALGSSLAGWRSDVAPRAQEENQ